MQLAGAIISLLGSIFIFLGALGILRMPDIYNRMQAGTKATTLGSMMALLGIGFAMQCCIHKMIILIFFILITNPISSHALARAAHHTGIKLTKRSVRDDFYFDRTNDESTIEASEGEKHDA